jgi:O-phosphoseryl-tRNA(Cys) synthetase
MRFDELNDQNYMMFAIKHYENPQAVTQEDFLEDMKRFKYVKRLLKKYKNSGDLKSHLLINHFIILYNVFDDAATPLLFYKIDRDLWERIEKFYDVFG